MKLNDQVIARFDNEIRIFAKKFGLTAETEHTILDRRTDVRLSSWNKYKRYVVLWDDVPSFAAAMNTVVSDASKFFGDGHINKINPQQISFEIQRVLFNDPATIVFWKDGTKTVVKRQDGDVYSEEVGLALCFAKKALGNQGNFNNVFKNWVPEAKEAATDMIDDSKLRESLANSASSSSIAAGVMVKFHEAMEAKRKADNWLDNI